VYLGGRSAKKLTRFPLDGQHRELNKPSSTWRRLPSWSQDIYRWGTGTPPQRSLVLELSDSADDRRSKTYASALPCEDQRNWPRDKDI